MLVVGLIVGADEKQQMSMMMSPLGKAFKIYNHDCKLPVERFSLSFSFSLSLLLLTPETDNRIYWLTLKG